MNITNELKDQYINLINQNLTTYEMANKLNVSPSTVKRNLIQMELKTLRYKKPIGCIEKEKLKELVDKNLSLYKLADELKCSVGRVKHWLKKYGLKTNSEWTIKQKISSKEIAGGYKTCPKCQVKFPLTSENFYIMKNKRFHYWCKKCNDDITYKKQLDRKKLCVEYKGGKCFICGYSKYFGALDFHHIDPKQKEFNISRLRTYSLEVLKTELDKCVCVCKNCHAEIHYGLHDISNTFFG